MWIHQTLGNQFVSDTTINNGDIKGFLKYKGTSTFFSWDLFWGFNQVRGWSIQTTISMWDVDNTTFF
jgi:hypothetical protein